MILTLTFHNFQINIHIYHSLCFYIYFFFTFLFIRFLFSPCACCQASSSFFFHTALFFSLLKNTQHFLQFTHFHIIFLAFYLFFFYRFTASLISFFSNIFSLSFIYRSAVFVPVPVRRQNLTRALAFIPHKIPSCIANSEKIYINFRSKKGKRKKEIENELIFIFCSRAIHFAFIASPKFKVTEERE